MNRAWPELVGALAEMVGAIDDGVRSSGYAGEPIEMYLAGGMAVNFYCGVRSTQDVDASFSRRLLLPFADLVFGYKRPDETFGSIYLDPTYNTTFAVLHEDFEHDAIEWEAFGNERRIVKLKLLAPVDLATSKLSRFLEHDQDDIVALASVGLIDSTTLRKRTHEALGYFVGNPAPVLTSLDLICRRIDALKQLPVAGPTG